VRAAYDLLCSRGCLGTTISEVAKHAGLAVPADLAIQKPPRWVMASERRRVEAYRETIRSSPANRALYDPPRPGEGHRHPPSCS
jgi:hypothetical protein